MRVYENEEKEAYIQEFMDSDESAYSFATQKGIPPTTFKGWIKQYSDVMFGKIDLTDKISTPAKKPTQNTTIFVCENIRIELKENYNRKLLKQIMEVLINAE